MKTVDCYGLTARETERRIWEYTDKGYQFCFSSFGNPTFAKYEGGKVVDSVSFVYPYIDLRFCRPRNV